jgi:catalase
LTDDEKRVCVTHESDCALPSNLDAFGAGFSCTSYSMLNADAKHNATAMHRATKQGTSNPDDEDFWFNISA